jgi:hypothetical protein
MNKIHSCPSCASSDLFVGAINSSCQECNWTGDLNVEKVCECGSSHGYLYHSKCYACRSDQNMKDMLEFNKNYWVTFWKN